MRISLLAADKKLNGYRMHSMPLTHNPKDSVCL